MQMFSCSQNEMLWSPINANVSVHCRIINMLLVQISDGSCHLFIFVASTWWCCL